MSVNEELQEHAEHAHDRFTRKAGATMAIIAAVLAVVGVGAHVATTEELLMQQRASDQWSYYQAKALRRYQSEVARDVLLALPGSVAGHTGDKYTANFERYQKEADEIQEKAREYGKESELAGRKALRLHFGEIFLELGIIFCSLAILVRRDAFWATGVISSMAGLAAAATVFLVRP